MTEHTPKSNLPYPDGSDGPDGPGGIGALANALDDPGWTPFATTTNVNLGGSGSHNSGEWRVLSNEIEYAGYVQLGSGFSVPGGITLLLPTPARTGVQIPRGTFTAKQAGGGEFPLEARFVDSTHVKLLAPLVGSNGQVQLVDPSPTFPYTFSTTDTLGWDFFYAGA